MILEAEKDLPRLPTETLAHVESSKNIEMVNIIDDDLWNPEPALRPEDEIILRKLHEMLQSTADDLKLLSGELSKFHEPGVQVKTAPTPLDEEFNEKVHIEEIVNAKFHGYKIKDQQSPCEQLKPQRDAIFTNKPKNNLHKPKITNTEARVNTTSILKKPFNKNLGISRTKLIEINPNHQDNTNIVKLNNGKVINNAPAVAYNEFSYKYVENKNIVIPRKALQVQEMPSINIRSELKEQKVLCLDILPDNNDSNEVNIHNSNIAVVAMKHETDLKQVPFTSNEPVQPTQSVVNIPTVRKVLKMSACESSGSSNILSSDTQIKLNTQKRIITAVRTPTKNSARLDRNKKIAINKKEPEKRKHLSLDEWKKKLNVVYGPSKSKKHKVPPSSKSKTNKVPPKKSESFIKPNILNNAEYIPYSQLTLGGVRVSDVEREISNMPNKNDLPLSPIVDKLLSSRDNSFTKNRDKCSTKILTTSDENLLHELIDIEKTVSETPSRNNIKKNVKEQVTKPIDASNDSNGVSEENRTYVDDFEEEKSENTEYQKRSSLSDDNLSNKSSSENVTTNSDSNQNKDAVKPGPSKIQSTKFKKTSNLSFKDSIDIFDFVHSVDTHDIAIQSNASNRISLKETQTSPRTDKTNIQPIHNDLWSSMDPKGEVEKMFRLEKDFIKKLIIDEYGDLLERDLTKPSTSKECKGQEKNVSASQKDTQTSPKHVKSVMTSPTRTKTRTTSPLALSLAVDHQTSPLVVTTQEETRLEIGNEDISINLSSPRFSLRLPQNSQEVLSNLGACTFQRKSGSKSRIITESTTSLGSSTSIDADNSSSELSSLGEIKLKLKRRLKKIRVSSISESSTSTISLSSSDLRSGSVLPLRSEGEVSLKTNKKKILNNNNKSEGETSLGLSK